MGLSGAVSTHGDIDCAGSPDKDKKDLTADNFGKLQAALFSNTLANTVNLCLHFALLYYLTFDSVW